MYPSDMTDAQWQVLAKHFAEMNKRGRPRVRSARDMINAIFYVQATGFKTVSKGGSADMTQAKESKGASAT